MTRVTVDPQRGSSTFYFDLGSRLETWPYEPDTKQWYLYQPDGNVLTYRSDGFYSQSQGSAPASTDIWRPVLSVVEGC